MRLNTYWLAFRFGLPSGMGEDSTALALCDIGAVFGDKGDLEGAIAAFCLSDRYRSSMDANWGLGQALYLHGEKEAALEALRKAKAFKCDPPGLDRLIALIQAELR